MLTKAEQDCLHLVGRGLKSKEIARRLNISPHTVDMRMRKALRVLGVARRKQAAQAFRVLLAEAGNPMVCGTAPGVHTTP
jgi:DNA-binding CsgD family transcriptional regulator